MSESLLFPEDVQFSQLIEGLRNGDSTAAEQLFQSYASRLTALARVRFSARLGRRIDPEDVVQSAMGSFFKHARAGEFTFQESGDVWRLLAGITLNKLRQKIEFHTAAKREIYREQLEQSGSLRFTDIPIVAREPSPEAQLAVLEEIDFLVSGLDDWQQRIVQMRLEGYGLEEIAQDVSRSERTVRRVMDKVKARLEARLLESSVAD